MNRSHIFPQCVLAAITLVGGGAGDGGSRDRAKCEAGIPLCSVAITTLLGAGVNPKLIQVLQEADPKMRLTARILLGEMPVWENIRRELYKAGTAVKWQGKSERSLGGSVLGCLAQGCSCLRKAQQSHQRVLKQKSATRGVLCLPGTSLPQYSCYTQWLLGEACERSGLGTAQWWISSCSSWSHWSLMLPLVGGPWGTVSWLPQFTPWAAQIYFSR